MRRWLPVLACIALTVSTVTAGPRFNSGSELATAMIGELPASIDDCSPDVVGDLHPDLEMVCAKATGSFGSFKGAFAKVLKGPVFGDYPWLAVTSWEALESGKVRIGYWLGASTVEVIFDKKTSGILFVTSKPYLRCGAEFPFHPAGMGGAGGPPPSALSPTGYPQRAAKDKVDGSVALEVNRVDGKPSVICIHHVTPLGQGFEFFAIEAVHVDGDFVFDQHDEPPEHATVLVSYSKASERKRGTAAIYH